MQAIACVQSTADPFCILLPIQMPPSQQFILGYFPTVFCPVFYLHCVVVGEDMFTPEVQKFPRGSRYESFIGAAWLCF